MTQAEDLYRLQEVDLNILQRQKRLDEIKALMADNQAVQAANDNLNQIRAVLTPLQKRARQLEQEIQTNTNKIQQTDETLYSGRVRNPKEMQDMQQEIASLKKRNSELEDILLETMMQVDETEAQEDAAEAVLQTATQAHEEANVHLIQEQTELRKERAEWIHVREQMLPAIDAEALKIYNTIRPRKNNQPVALLVNRSCSACRVELDMAVANEVRKAQKITYCTSCGRILAYKSG